MKLILQNGYPYPYPKALTDAQSEAISQAAGGNTLTIEGVDSFQWLHTVTLEFQSLTDCEAAQKQTGWAYWDVDGFVLEAQSSDADGYGHPAIVANGWAYCGFILA